MIKIKMFKKVNPKGWPKNLNLPWQIYMLKY